MDSSTGQHQQQEMCSQTLESILACTKSPQEKKPRPADMQVIKCPRCDSTNTKFCYYNNYSLSQPRYFCKSCRRYWTKGGTLRNVPVGGGCRKNKRSSSSSSPSSSSSKSSQDQPMTTIPIPIPSYDSSDLSLAIARLQKQSNSGQLFGLDDNHDHFSIWGNLNPPHQNHGDHAVLGGLGLIDSPFDALRMSGFFENPPNGNLYYGMGNVNMEMENGGIGMCGAQGMGIPFEDFTSGTTASTAVTTVKQEVRNGGRDDEARLLWGYPWQGVGGGDGNEVDFDSNRSMNWNGINGSYNWHGLLNNPLM
ncbi:hypothetical protein OROHE_021419 [Orobanche hederae]